MDFEKFSKKTASLINQQIKKLLGEWRNETNRISSSLIPLVDKFIDSCQGGKRIRGVLVVLGYEIARSKDHLGGVPSASPPKADQPASWESFRLPPALRAGPIRGGLNEKAIYKVAAAYEIFHTAILAHDDIIDQSPLRRGQPSLYQALGGNHHGVSQAISLGDAGFFLAVKTISEIGFPDEGKSKALSWFVDTMLDTALGEMLDVEKGDVITIAKLKTARYTICGPLVLGAILGEASSHLPGVSLADARDKQAHLGGVLGRLMEFGENLGIAFQIQDDILGIFGSAEQTGKSVTSDIEEGKNTLLYNYALKYARPLQRQMLGQYYGQGPPAGGSGNQGLQKVREIFKSTGALNYAKKTAEEYKSKALKVLPTITKDKEMSKMLLQLAEYLVERSR